MNMDMDSVLKDFLMRIEHYEERYEPLEEDKEADLSFMKIYNTGRVRLFDYFERTFPSNSNGRNCKFDRYFLPPVFYVF